MTFDSTQILSKREIALVLKDNRRRARRSRNTHQNLIIFRLTIGCGLRASEIAGLELRDLHLAGDRPHVHVRAKHAKGRKPRKVPLWWDQGTHEALADWHRIRTEVMGAGPRHPVICVLSDRPVMQVLGDPALASRSQVGAPLTRQQVGVKWKLTVGCLGADRQRQLHTHSGRHTYGSYMVRERGVAAVRDAMGHANIATTSIYLHVTPEDLDRRGNVYNGNNGAPASEASTGPGNDAKPPGRVRTRRKPVALNLGAVDASGAGLSGQVE